MSKFWYFAENKLNKFQLNAGTFPENRKDNENW